jgi:hypothetical protein
MRANIRETKAGHDPEKWKPVFGQIMPKTNEAYRNALKRDGRSPAKHINPVEALQWLKF